MTIDKFVDVLLEEQRGVGRKCDLARALDRMDPEFAHEVCEAMASDASAAAISRTLIRFDYPVTEGTIRRCRRVCDCWKAADAVA